jgi:DNA-binding response OmpR family regulator
MHAKLLLLPEQLTVQIDDRQFALTREQFLILTTLATEPGRVFQRSELVEPGIGALAKEDSVDKNIQALRRKLGPHRPLIETVRSIGYRFRKRTPGEMAQES